MSSPLFTSSPKVRFDAFELDPSAGTVRKAGIPIKLQPQPFRLLLLLVGRPGQVVTRDEIQRHLWGGSTFVDFERGINFSINQIRAALCDNADRPRYIETLPRIGYRFIGTIVGDVIPEPAGPFLLSPEGNRKSEPQQLAHEAPVIDQRPSAASPSAASPMKEGKSGANRLRARIYLAFAIVLLVGGAAILRWRSQFATRSVGEVRSLAVLPLENLSGDSTEDYFADGMTDELITDLGEIGALRVISRTSIMQYKGVHKPLPQIARELNVDVIVEGTVMRSGDRVRITAQLLDARSDKHLWAQSYEGDLRNVLALQSQVADAIASKIRARLSQPPGEPKIRPFSNPEAQDAYFRGHYFAAKGTIEDLQKAITYFSQAIEIEPGQAPAYAGLATCYVSLGHMMYLSPQQSFPPAKAAALKALELDDTSAEAHTALGSVKLLYDWDFPGAEKELRLALRLNPNSMLAQSSYASYLDAMGRPEEALAQVRQALKIDPLSLAAITDVAWHLYWSRHYDEAIDQAKKVSEINPDFFSPHVCLGLAYEQKHEFSLAIAELTKATGFCRGRCYGLMGQVSALAGDRASAMEALHQLDKRPYVSPWLVAIVYAQLGDKDEAFDWLEKAYQGREHDLVFSSIWPMFDGLRSDPRFIDLMRRIGLPQPS